MAYFIGVDVGTASTRAALVSSEGTVIQTAIEPIEILHPQPGVYEQSSEDIWRAVIKTVREVLKLSKLAPSEIKGIGFDATCSMVALDSDFQPVSCSTTGDICYNIIMWMDLPDFLTWRATGSLSRSVCSLVCKWGYEIQGPDRQGWSDDFLRTVGLEELIEDSYSSIGTEVQYPGEPCGSGVSSQAASELGLLAGTPVATSLIDAYAGGLACLACVPSDHSISLPPVTSRLALICGTSTCHMVVSHDAVFVPGVWGPYYSAMIPGLWTNEGGQSATGKLVCTTNIASVCFCMFVRKREIAEGMCVFECAHLAE